MDMKVSELLASTPVAQKPQVPDVDESFKFMLASNIQEADLQSKVCALMSEISDQGKKISKHTDVRDMRKYRSLIRDFINEIVYHSHEFSRENFLDKRGRHRVYGIIRLVDENLDKLAEELIKEEQDHIKILNLVGEIRGLLLDIIT